MSDYIKTSDKVTARLDSLYRTHRDLDDQIKKEFDKFANDSILKPLKTKKLDLKTEITNLEQQLEALK
tara:strand:- start:253 stop:456 length:204 start_codon:yes stop_codon:yes gene_type:complete